MGIMVWIDRTLENNWIKNITTNKKTWKQNKTANKNNERNTIWKTWQMKLNAAMH